MRGKELFNFPAFDQAEKELLAAGYETFSPARRDRSAGFYPEDLSEWTVEAMEATGMTLRECLHADTEFITLKADGIALLDGWRDSKGAQAEKALAVALGLPVMYVEDWIRDAERLEQTMQDYVDDEPFVSSAFAPRKPWPWQDQKSNQEDAEVRLTSSTGGQKGSKLARFDLVPVGPLTELAEHFGRGAAKYEDRNWERGYEWSLSYAALMRHLTQFWNGEDLDPETGGKHIIAVAWHALALAEFMDKQREFDNRP